MSEVRLGALCWNQYTDWPSLLEAGRRAERLDYYSIWTWDSQPNRSTHPAPARVAA